MLARLASELWLPNAADSSSLFIERDGECFRFVLEYMRDGEVSLAADGNVTKHSLLKELTYFGFENVEPTAISIEIVHHLQAPKYMAMITADYNGELSTLKKTLVATELAIACATVSHGCCMRYMSTGCMDIEFHDKPQYCVPCQLDVDVIQAAKTVTRLGPERSELNQALAKYGLCTSNYYETRDRSTNYGNKKLNVRLERC